MTYGKGLMGAHASQMTKEERWTVVHHVELLQGKNKVFAGEEVVADSTATDVETVEVEEVAHEEAAH